MTSDIGRAEGATAAQAGFDESLQIFIDQAPAALAMLDREMRYLSASRRWRLDFGLGERDLRGASHYELFPEIPDQWRAIHRRALAGEVLQSDAERFERIDGSQQWVRWEVRPWYEAGGQIGGILIYSEDLSKLKSQENALRESAEQLNAIIGTAMDAIISVNESGTVVVFNAAAESMFGCASANALGAPLETFIPAQFRRDHAARMIEFSTSEKMPRRMGRARIVTGLRSGGEEFPVEASISHVRVAGQRLYTVIIRDITASQQAQRALRANKANLEGALASMTDAIVICDTQGRVIELNDAFAKFYRFKTKEECPKTLAEYAGVLEVFTANGDLAPIAQWATSRGLKGESANNVEFRLRRKDTGETWVGSHSFGPIRSSDGVITGSVATARDITDFKRVQNELVSAHADLQRLVEARDRVQDEERKRIARELHDDLQQNLAAIRMELSEVRSRLAADRAGLGPLVAAADNLTLAAIVSTRRIVNDLRPQMLESLGLAPALKSMVSTFSERTGIPCSFEDSQKFDVARALATCLYRVTQEALNNVAKHAGASNVTVALQDVGPELVRLRVSDDGLGIKAGKPRSSESFGLLGMTERVRAVGGQLRIDSKPGKGTTVEVLAPVSSASVVGRVDADGFVAALHRSTTNGLKGARLDGHGLQAELGRPLQGVVDALEGSAAVLDRSGTISIVNRAWARFAQVNGDADLGACGPGVSYLETCRRSAESDPSVAPVVCGLADVLEGRSDSFTSEYPCDMPDGQNWFRMHVAPVAGDGVLVTHVNLTHRIAQALPVEMQPARPATAAPAEQSPE